MSELIGLYAEDVWRKSMELRAARLRKEQQEAAKKAEEEYKASDKYKRIQAFIAKLEAAVEAEQFSLEIERGELNNDELLELSGNGFKVDMKRIRYIVISWEKPQSRHDYVFGGRGKYFID